MSSMEFIIVGMICFSKIDTNSICMPFEQSPRVEYRNLDKCIEDTEKQKIKLRKSFNEEGLLVDELIITCVKNPYKSET
jgi:hypothetical protein